MPMIRTSYSKALRRKDDRIIIHFDYDCFYASVFEAENPALKTLPLGVQQKQIIVTANYEGRRRGLRKLQLITEAKHVCPEAIIVLGEDLTRFRDASKALYNFIRAFSWSDKVERLGFDEVFCDVTDLINYNVELLNQHDLPHSFFCLSKEDPTLGFDFNATTCAGHTWPSDADVKSLLQESSDRILTMRLILGSHLAMHIRHQLEEQKGYTSTVGIGTTKLTSKLIGNVNKPKGQTTLLPPYEETLTNPSNIHTFLEEHDIGNIPYIGFKLAQKLRELALGRQPDFAKGLVYGPTRENVKVGQVRQLPELDPEMLEKLLGGPGMPHGVGLRTYQLINGVDDTGVAAARNVPRQISIEDSYIRLDTMEQVTKELVYLSTRLIDRMHTDLMDGDDWMAKPSTLRLTTRPRPPLNADGTRTRSFNRISRSMPAPTFLFSPTLSSEELASRLFRESLMPLFRKLHPERSGWNLSLVNVAVTGMDEKADLGGDIGSMFKKQEEVKKEWEEILPLATEELEPNDKVADPPIDEHMEDCIWDEESESVEDEDEDAAELSSCFTCDHCGSVIPAFARAAHERFHADG